MAELPHVFDAMAHAAMSNFDLALDLASQGVSVFPCRPDNGPLDASGTPEWKEKTPYPGVLWRSASTTNETRIRQWWSAHPDAIPAIDLGKVDIVVIDCDRKPGAPDGVAAFNDLAGRHGDALDTVPIVETITSGLHHYYQQWDRHGNGRGSLPPGVDVRGAGGYVIAPGATMLDGRRYEPVQGHFLSPPHAPAWLVAALTTERAKPAAQFTHEPGPPVSDERKRQYGHAALDEEMRDLAAAPPGSRNESANIAAFKIGRLVGGDCLTFNEAYAALANAALSWGIPANDKALGPKGTIARALRDGMSEPREPPADGQIITLARSVVQSEDGTLSDAETGEVLDPPATANRPSSILDGIALGRDVDWTRPQGLLEEMTQWMLASSRRPNRPFCLASAISTLSAVCGRHLFGPTGTALNLYVVCIADTTVGKGRPFSAVAEILRSAKLGSLHSTGKGFSVSALENLVATQPSVVATVDEIGANLLAKMSGARASSHEVGMRGALLELWSREAGMAPFYTHRRANAEPVEIPSPSFSLFGASTGEAFYGAMTSGSTKDGFLNRFLIVHAAPRSKKVDFDFAARSVPQLIIDSLWSIIPQIPGNVGNALGVFALTTEPDVTIIPWSGKDVEAAANQFEEDILELSDAHAEQRPLMGRIFEYAVRLAALHAVSRAGRATSVTMADLEWGAAWSLASARQLIDGALSLMAANDYEAKFNAIKNVIERELTITRSNLLRQVRSVSARERDDILKHLKEGGWIEHVDIQTATKPASGFRWLG